MLFLQGGYSVNGKRVDGEPYPWPYDGDLRAENTAPLVIDMQIDFCGADLELMLRARRVANLILTGITTDVCVHTTLREANDRGFECLLLEDCCGATDHGNHLGAIKMIKMQGGVFGSVSSSEQLIRTLG